jgi:GT2 family glycosyltransferase
MSLLKAAKNYSSILVQHFKSKGLRCGAKAALTLFTFEIKRKFARSPYTHYLEKEESLFKYFYAKPILGEPLISICIPIYKPNMRYLKKAIESIEQQTYANWEICMADDNSRSEDLNSFIAKLTDDHGSKKIRFVQRSENGNISKCTNSAINIATGDYILLLDQDDALSKHTCHCLIQAFGSNDKCQLAYSDEDKMCEKGKRSSPYFKSSFNQELLKSHNLFTHALAFRKNLLSRIGHFDSTYDGAQDYDFALRASEILAASEIFHIPRILYHWRAHSGSTANSGDVKPYAMQAGKLALQAHLDRINSGGIAELQNNNSYRVHYSLPANPPLVSIIIPTREQAVITENLIKGIEENTDYQNIEIILVDNGSTSTEFANFAASFLEKHSRLRRKLVRVEGDFNYSKLNNEAAKISSGELLCLMNNDIEIIQDSWLAELASIGSRPEVGVVGPMLLYPDESVQHAGIVLGIGGWAGHLHKGFPMSHPGIANRLQIQSSFSAVTGACLLTSKKVWDQLGGLNEESLKIACNDVDYCLRAWDAGKQVIFTPYSKLIHHESKSRGYEDTPEKIARFSKEVEYMWSKWSSVMSSDPFYNPNLTLNSESGEVSKAPSGSILFRAGHSKH